MYTTQQPSANPFTRASSSRGRGSVPPVSGLRNTTPQRSSQQQQYQHHHLFDNSTYNQNQPQHHQHSGVTKLHYSGIPTHAVSTNNNTNTSSSPNQHHQYEVVHQGHQYEAAHFPAPSHISHVSYVRRPTTQQTSELHRLQSPIIIRDITTKVAQGVKEEQQRAGHLLLREGRHVAGLSSPGLPVDMRRERLVGILSPEREKHQTATPRASDHPSNSAQNKLSRAFAMLRSPELVANAVRASQSLDRTVPPTSTAANYYNNKTNAPRDTSSSNYHPLPHRHYVGPVSAEMSRVVAASTSPPRGAGAANRSSSQHQPTRLSNSQSGTTTTVALTAVALQKAAELQQQLTHHPKGGGPSGRTSMAWSEATPRNQYNTTQQQQQDHEDEPAPSNLASTATPQQQRYQSIITSNILPVTNGDGKEVVGGGEGSRGGRIEPSPTPVANAAAGVVDRHSDPQFQYLTTPNSHNQQPKEGRPISPSQKRSMSSQLQYPPPREAFFSTPTPPAAANSTTNTSRRPAAAPVDTPTITRVPNHADSDTTTGAVLNIPTTTTTLPIGSSGNTPDARRLVDASAELFRSSVTLIPLPTTPANSLIPQKATSDVERNNTCDGGGHQESVSTTMLAHDNKQPIVPIATTVVSDALIVQSNPVAAQAPYIHASKAVSHLSSHDHVAAQPDGENNAATTHFKNPHINRDNTAVIEPVHKSDVNKPTNYHEQSNTFPDTATLPTDADPSTTASTERNPTMTVPSTFSDIPNGAEGVVYSNVATPVTSSSGTPSYPPLVGQKRKNSGGGVQVDKQREEEEGQHQLLHNKTPLSNHRQDTPDDGNAAVQEEAVEEDVSRRVTSVSQPSMFAVSPQTPSHARAESSHNIVVSPVQEQQLPSYPSSDADDGKLQQPQGAHHSPDQATIKIVPTTVTGNVEARSPSPQVPTTNPQLTKKAGSKTSVPEGFPSTTTQAPVQIVEGQGKTLVSNKPSTPTNASGVSLEEGKPVADDEELQTTTTRAQSYPPPPVERALHIHDDEVTSPLPAAYSSAPPIPQPRGVANSLPTISLTTIHNHSNEVNDAIPQSSLSSSAPVDGVEKTRASHLGNDGTSSSSNKPACCETASTHRVGAATNSTHDNQVVADVTADVCLDQDDVCADHDDISVHSIDVTDDDDYLDVVEVDEEATSSSSSPSFKSSSSSSSSSVPDTFNHSITLSVEDSVRLVGDHDGASSRQSSLGRNSRGQTETTARSGRQSPLPPLSPRTAVPGSTSRSVSGVGGNNLEDARSSTQKPLAPPRSDYDEFIEIASNVESSLIAENLHDLLNELVIEKEARGRKILQIAQGCVWDILGLQALWEPIYRTQLDEEWEDISMQIAEMNGDKILETVSREQQQQLLFRKQQQQQERDDEHDHRFDPHSQEHHSDVVESRSASAHSQDSPRVPFRTTVPASTASSRRTTRQSSLNRSHSTDSSNTDRPLHPNEHVGRVESHHSRSSANPNRHLAADAALELEGDEAHGRGEIQVMCMHNLIDLMRRFADGRAQLLLDGNDPASFIHKTASSTSSVDVDRHSKILHDQSQRATTPRNETNQHHVSFDQSVSSLNTSVGGSRSTTTNLLSFVPSHLISDFSELEAAEGRQRQVWANHFINQGLACLLVSMTERLEEVHRMQFIVGCRGGVEAEIADAVGPVASSSSFRGEVGMKPRTASTTAAQRQALAGSDDVPPMVDILVNEHRLQNDGDDEGLVDLLGNLEVLAAVGSSLLCKRQEEAQKAAAARRRQARNEKREAKRQLQEERRRQEEQAARAATSSSFLLSRDQVERDLMRWETLESEIDGVGGGNILVDTDEEDEDAPELVGGAKNALQHLLARAAGHYQSSSAQQRLHTPSSDHSSYNGRKEVLGSLPMLLSLPAGWALRPNDHDDEEGNGGRATLHLPLRYAGRPSSDIAAITAAMLLDTAGFSPRTTKDYLYQHGKADDENTDQEQQVITLAVFSRWHYTQFIIPAILKALREAHERHSQLLITGRQSTPRRRQSPSTNYNHEKQRSPRIVAGSSSSQLSSIHSQEEEEEYQAWHGGPQTSQQRSRSQQVYAHRNRAISSSLPRGGSATRSQSMASSVDSSVPDLHHPHQHLQAPFPMLEVTPTSISASRASSQGSNTTFNVVRGASSQQLDISTTSGRLLPHQQLLQHPSQQHQGGAQRTATQGSGSPRNQHAFSPSPRRSASVVSSTLIPHRYMTSFKQQPSQHASVTSSIAGVPHGSTTSAPHHHQLSPRARVVKIATNGDLFSINYSPSSAHKREENDISRNSQYATIEGSPIKGEGNDEDNQTRTAPATFMERKRQLERGGSLLTANQSGKDEGAGSFYKSWSSLSPARGGGDERRHRSSSQLSSPQAKRVHSHLSTICAASVASESIQAKYSNQPLQLNSSSGLYTGSIKDGGLPTKPAGGGGNHTMDDSRNAALEAYMRRTDSKTSSTQREQSSMNTHINQAQPPSTAAIIISRNAVVRQLFNKSDTSRNGRLRLSMVVATFRELPDIIREVEDANDKKRATIGGSDQDGQMVLRYNALNELMRITTTPGARGAAALAVPVIREAYQEARREEKLQRRTVNDDGMIGEKGFAHMVLKCLLP